ARPIEEGAGELGKGRLLPSPPPFVQGNRIWGERGYRESTGNCAIRVGIACAQPSPGPVRAVTVCWNGRDIPVPVAFKWYFLRIVPNCHTKFLYTRPSSKLVWT